MAKIKAVAFDLDGTIYFGKTLAPDALKTINQLKRRGIPVSYFTNNSSCSRQMVCERLAGLGIPTTVDQVINSAYATAQYLKDQKIKKVFVLGTAGLVKELNSAGIKARKTGVVEAVVIGYDPEFCFDKLAGVLQVAFSPKVKVVACNRDAVYPVEGGKLLPALGPAVAAVEEMLGRTVDVMVGKPNPFMLQVLARRYHCRVDQILVVGDSLDTDVMMAKAIGARSVLIGKHMPHRKKIKPDYSITRLSALEGIIDGVK